MILRGNALRIPLESRSCDLVIGSPPYVDACLYLENGVDLGISREPEVWVSWMLDVTAEALRVSRGLVLWVCSGVTRDRNYWPACEGLAWEWFKRGGDCHAYRPCYWHRVGIPGSGGDEWFRADVEYVLAFKRPGPLPWSDNKANGQPPGISLGRSGKPSNIGWNPGRHFAYETKTRNGRERAPNLYTTGHIESRNSSSHDNWWRTPRLETCPPQRSPFPRRPPEVVHRQPLSARWNCP